jgi:hypothetical protein
MNPNDLVTEQYLNKVYENLSQHQQHLMLSLKNLTADDMSKETDITKQLTLINTINVNVMRLRNLKRKIELKNNL